MERRYTKNVMQFWKDLEGHLLEGVSRLQTCRYSDEPSALFTCEPDPVSRVARDVMVYRADPEREAQMISRLEAAQHLHHPNLIGIQQVGASTLDDQKFVYAVMEHTDEKPRRRSA